jgi:CRISPR-associated protein Csd1
LASVMRWRQRFSAPAVIINPVFESYQRPGSRTAPKDQWLAVTATGEKLPLYFRPNTAIDATFSVDGQVLVYDKELLEWWSQWFRKWLRDRETACLNARGGGRICVVSGVPDAPISNSHLPKIRGRVLPSFGATLASAEADSVHSYGLSEQRAEIPGTRKGPDASYSNVSVRAAISYCLALNHLLQDEDLHIDLGPVSVCFWGKQTPKTGGVFRRMLEQAYPSQVRDFLRAPFAGDMDREVLNRDRLYTVALSGNAGRVVIQHWLDQPLTDAIENFAHWWSDLQIVPLFLETEKKKSPKSGATDGQSSPFTIPNLARVTLRESKKQKTDKLVGERIVQLYRAALEATTPSIMLLKPILDEFHSALVKDDAKKPTYPFSQSRFALIKLILFRNRKEGGFMPTPQLADTPEPAYNLGRLLAVFESLQDRYHDFEKKGAGVVERYYGTASSAPAAVFPLLCRLARHHLSKVRKDDESAANRLDRQIGEILQKFQPDSPGAAPCFKRMLTLPEQGIFALGFYQQRSYDRACSLVLSNLGKARELREKQNPFDEPLSKARDLATEFGYKDLIAAVGKFEATS